MWRMKRRGEISLIKEEFGKKKKKKSHYIVLEKKLNQQQQPRGATNRPSIETNRCFARGATEEAEEDRV
jgi:hypothetical protein